MDIFTAYLEKALRALPGVFCLVMAAAFGAGAIISAWVIIATKAG